MTDPTPQELPAAPARGAEIDGLVDRWVREVLFNVPLDTQVINRIRSSQDRLKADIAALLGKD
jgi:hypothetical protein